VSTACNSLGAYGAPPTRCCLGSWQQLQFRKLAPLQWVCAAGCHLTARPCPSKALSHTFQAYPGTCPLCCSNTPAVVYGEHGRDARHPHLRHHLRNQPRPQHQHCTRPLRPHSSQQGGGAPGARNNSRVAAPLETLRNNRPGRAGPGRRLGRQARVPARCAASRHDAQAGRSSQAVDERARPQGGWQQHLKELQQQLGACALSRTLQVHDHALCMSSSITQSPLPPLDSNHDRQWPIA
jgi:hypothetical protein